MVMGLVSSKRRELEEEDELVRRMEDAAAIVGGMDRLAISPQCGFASVMVGNELDEDTQWRKLALNATWRIDSGDTRKIRGDHIRISESGSEAAMCSCYWSSCCFFHASSPGLW